MACTGIFFLASTANYLRWSGAHASKKLPSSVAAKKSAAAKSCSVENDDGGSSKRVSGKCSCPVVTVL